MFTQEDVVRFTRNETVRTALAHTVAGQPARCYDTLLAGVFKQARLSGIMPPAAINPVTGRPR